MISVLTQIIVIMISAIIKQLYPIIALSCGVYTFPMARQGFTEVLVFSLKFAWCAEILTVLRSAHFLCTHVMTEAGSSPVLL